jgi:sugar/nucleoside kinase (ribokinase family)
MSLPQVLISGYPGFDYILRIDHYPKEGETAIILDPPGIPQPKPGGCASNIAVCLARLGICAAPSLILGEDDNGRQMRALLQAEGVSVDYLTFHPNGKTATTFLFINPQGGHQTYYFPGCADADVDIELSIELIQAIKFAVITVASPHHTWQVLHQLRSSRATLIWSLRNDPHAFPPDLVKELLSRCSILVMNLAEQKALMNWINVENVWSILNWGIESLIVTLGEQGSMLLKPSQVIQIPAVVPKQYVDPTGAGDAYVGGLLAGLCIGFDLETSAKIGSVVASFVIEDWGCQTSLPTWEAVQERYYQSFHERLNRF